MIKSIVETKGAKRFKKEGQENSVASFNGAIDLNTDIRDAQVASEIFRKMTTTTRYAQTFGEKPKAATDFSILKTKPFAKLPIAQILKPQIA